MRITLVVLALLGARPIGCGATPLPADMDRLPTVTMDAADASACMVLTGDDVTWMIISAQGSGTTLHFNGCLEVTP
jgi:hypothetical protein